MEQEGGSYERYTQQTYNFSVSCPHTNTLRKAVPHADADTNTIKGKVGITTAASGIIGARTQVRGKKF